jgi:hypothetical protein
MARFTLEGELKLGLIINITRNTISSDRKDSLKQNTVKVQDHKELILF